MTVDVMSGEWRAAEREFEDARDPDRKLLESPVTALDGEHRGKDTDRIDEAREIGRLFEAGRTGKRR